MTSDCYIQIQHLPVTKNENFQISNLKDKGLKLKTLMVHISVTRWAIEIWKEDLKSVEIMQFLVYNDSSSSPLLLGFRKSFIK